MRAILQCPHCGFKVTEKIPAQPLKSYECLACKKTVQAKGCCVFCDFGTKKCHQSKGY